ncbi:MFS transporter [Cellulomonas soli]
MRRAWWRVAAVLFAVAWGGNEFTPLLVLYRTRSHLGMLTVDVLLAAYVLGIVPGLLVGGPLSDRYGRRPLLLPAPVLGAIGSAVLAAGAHSPALLFVGRVCSGVALGLVMAVGTELGQGAVLARVRAGGRHGGRGTPRVARTHHRVRPRCGRRRRARAVGSVARADAVPGERHDHARCARRPPGRRRDATPQHAAGPARRRPADPRRRPPPVRAGRRADGPWVFGTAASAYAILPSLLAARVPGLAVGLAGLMCLVALGCGVLVQLGGRRLDSPADARGLGVGMLAAVPGLALAAATATTGSVGLGLVAAAVLGCSYGLLLVGGLQEVQRIAGPDDLAGLTAVYYSVAYLGFFVPAVLAGLHSVVGYPAMFVVGSALAALCLGVVLLGWRRHLPATAAEDTPDAALAPEASAPARVAVSSGPARSAAS